MKNLLNLTGALAITALSLAPTLAAAATTAPGTSVQSSTSLHISLDTPPIYCRRISVIGC